MTQTSRTSSLDIHPLFLNRWSPRAFDPKPLANEDLMRLFEAARWAPSGSNLQPWRFVYAHRDTSAFETLLGTLVEFNQAWAKNASALVFLGSVTSYDGQRPVSHSDFDAGAAWMSLALQAHHQGLISHAMAGVDYAAASKALGLPDSIKLLCAVAIGYQGKTSDLPEFLASREAPSSRQPLEAMVFKDSYTGGQPINPTA